MGMLHVLHTYSPKSPALDTWIIILYKSIENQNAKGSEPCVFSITLVVNDLSDSNTKHPTQYEQIDPSYGATEIPLNCDGQIWRKLLSNMCAGAASTWH